MSQAGHCLASPPPAHLFDPRLSKRHWQEPGKATPLFQLAERGGDGFLSANDSCTHPTVRKCKAESQSSNKPQASCPLVGAHSWSSEAPPGERWPPMRSRRRRALLCGVCVRLQGFAVPMQRVLVWGSGTTGPPWEQPGSLDSLPHSLVPLVPPTPGPFSTLVQEQLLLFPGFCTRSCRPACRAGYHVTPPGFIPMQDR